jgi:hypothetical protein
MTCRIREYKVVYISVAEVPTLNLVLKMAKPQKPKSDQNPKHEESRCRNFHLFKNGLKKRGRTRRRERPQKDQIFSLKMKNNAITHLKVL